jgi:hypothetical protein
MSSPDLAPIPLAKKGNHRQQYRAREPKPSAVATLPQFLSVA